MFYTGIGSRNTPKEVRDMFSRVAIYLSKNNLVLRSGGADGADIAFELGCDKVNGKKEIYIPWKDFNNSKSKFYTQDKKAIEIAKRFHPKWDILSNGAKKLHTRNVYQILGTDLNTPSKFVICWTKNGEGLGGTGQALRIAKAYNIPIFDCGTYKDINDCRKNLKQFIDKYM